MRKPTIKILLIEDDEEDYIITNDLLEDIPDSKYHLDWAPSFEEGLKLIESEDYALFLIDYRLGKMEGLDLVEQISSAKKDIPFILLTGQGDKTLDQKAMEAGAADFLTKTSLSSDLLDRAIRYSIQHHTILRELKQRKERLKDAQALAHVGNYDWDIATGTIIWSDELFRIFGYAPQSFQVTRKNFNERIHPDDKDFVINKVDQILATKKPLSFGYRIVCPERGVRHLQGIREVELGPDGNVSRLFGSIQDVTKQVAHEKDLLKEKEMAQTYLDMAGSIIVIIDGDETVQQINQEGARILGYPENEIVGMNWFETFIPDEVRVQTRDFFHDLILQKISNISHYENEIISKDGKKHLIRWSNRVLLDEQGRPLSTISSGTDITQQRKYEIKILEHSNELELKVTERTKQLSESELNLKEALKKEQELSELKSRFVAMASHEFRTPLSSILSSASLIGRYTETEQQEKRTRHINRIKSSVTNLTSILNDFLSLEKVESGKVDSKIQEINFEEFVEDLLEEVHLLTQDGQQIRFKHLGKPIVNLDEHLTKNILINLLSNAIKYSPNGEDVEK